MANKKGKVGAPSSWGDLQEELLALIAERLYANVDLLRFRAVCSSWRSSARSLAGRTFNGAFRVPALNLSGEDNTIPERFCASEEYVCPFLTFETRTIYLVQQQKNKSPAADISSNKCRLALVREKPYVPGKDKMRAEFLTKAALGYRRKTMSEELNILEVSMIELYKYYYVGADRGTAAAWIRKIAFIFSRSAADEYIAVGLYGNHGKLAFLKSSREGIWTPLDNNQAGYSDVIDYNGRFYAVHYTGKLVRIDLSSKVTEVAPSSVSGVGGLQKTLVESAGDLLLLDKYIDFRTKRPNTWFKVYKLNLEEEIPGLVEIGSLGDRMLFLTSRCCNYSVSAQHLPGYTPNCIYLTEHCDNAYHMYWNPRLQLSTSFSAVFNLEDGTYKRIKNTHAPLHVYF